MTALREITAGPLAPLDPAEVRAGAVPQLMWVKIADLVVDDRFQRPLGDKNWRAIGRIAAVFSWGKFAPVVAAPIEGGRYALIDGQHRTHAAHLCGFESVPAMIVTLTPEAQAASFAAINGNVTQITAFHILKAALAAGERWAEACRDAVAAAGCELMTYNAGQAKKPRQVFALQLVRRFVEAGKAQAVTRGLAALAAQEDATHLHYANSALEPWFMAIDSLGGRLDGADLASFLSEHDLVTIRDRMQAAAADPLNRGKSGRDLTRDVLAALLKRAFAAPALPAVHVSDEAAVGQRMAAVAAAERKRMRAVT